MVLDRPLTGVGIGCFKAAHRIRDGWGLNAHNMYIQLLAEVGLISATILFVFLFEMLRLNRRTARLLAPDPAEIGPSIYMHLVTLDTARLTQRVPTIFSSCSITRMRTLTGDSTTGKATQSERPFFGCSPKCAGDTCRSNPWLASWKTQG